MLTSSLSVCVSAQERVDTLEEVVVTGTGTEHLLKDVPVHTEVISRKMLDSYGGKSLEDILGGLTASFAFNEGDMGSQMQLGGLGNSYILVLVDGKRLHGDVGGENDLALIDPNNIDHIEIVKGAQSALYGSDAIAGVVNVITRKHVDSGVCVENTTRYGRYNDVRQHDGLAVNIGKLKAYTNFQLQHSDGWQNTSQEYTEAMLIDDSRNMTVNKHTSWQLAQRVTYDLTRNVELYADGSVYAKTINRPVDGKYASCDVYTYDLAYKNASFSAGGKWKLGTADYVTLNADWNRHAYYHKYTDTTLEDGYDPNGNFTNYFPYFAGQRSLQSDQRRTMVEARGVFTLTENNTLSAGAEYRYDYLKAPMRVENGQTDDWTMALYAQEQLQLTDWLNVVAGARVNHNASYGTRVTPKVSSMVTLGDFKIRAGWSEGFKTPTPKELHYRYLRRMGEKTFYYLGNTDLKPQTSDYVSCGVEYRTNVLTVSVTGYVNKLRNMITLVNVPVSEIPVGVSTFMGDGSNDIVPRMYENMESARTYGVDLNVSCRLTRDLSVGGNYSYLDTKAEVYNVTHSRLDDIVIDGMAHNKWNMYAVWRHDMCRSYRMSVGLYTRGSSKRYYQNYGDGKAYQIWKLTTTHEFGKKKSDKPYKLECGLDNMFNYVDRTPHPYHLGTTTPPMSVYASFSIRVNAGKKVALRHLRTTGDDADN